MQDFTNFNPNQQPTSFTVASETSEAVFFQRVYAWMFIALGVTAGLGFALSSSQAWLRFIASSPIFYVIALAPLGFAFFLSAKLETLSTTAIKGILLTIAACFGATTLAVCFVVYPSTALIKAFVCAAGIYGAMAVYGLVTKRSLQAMGGFLLMGVVGLIIASVVNIFVKSGPMDFVICVIGVLLFAGLTAYDHQKLRVMFFSASQAGAGEETLVRYGLMGSLTLYLDFLNLFLFLLRLFGRGDE